MTHFFTEKLFLRTRKTLYFFFLLLFYTGTDSLYGQPNTGISDSTSSRFRIVFYNVENLFDIYDDPFKDDDEFLPEGEKNWTYYRYMRKLNNLSKVLIAVGEWDPPVVIGLAEIENWQVISDLIHKTALRVFDYRIVHANSKTNRGTDVAILYRPDRIELTGNKFIPVDLKDSGRETRDILLASFKYQQDTLNVFVNHWPSRLGGKVLSESDRQRAAETLRHAVDSLQHKNINARILCMGDFNDEPDDKSIREALNASDSIQDKNKYLFNLSYKGFRQGSGSVAYKEINYRWYMFDQMMVTIPMLSGDGMVIDGQECRIFKPGWLLNRSGNKPFRTFQGPLYLGGFSDHLPVFADVVYLK